MSRYIFRRLVTMPLVLLGIVTLTFFASRLAGDPIVSIVGLRGAGNPDTVAAARVKWGLDGSIVNQYFVYLGHLVGGDLGISITTRQPVVSDITRRLPATAELAIGAMLFGGLGGVLLGVLAAARKGRWVDSVIRGFAVAGASLPVFWTALVLLFFLYAKTGWLPGPGRLPARIDAPAHVTGMYTVDSLLAGNFTLFRQTVMRLLLPSFVLGWALMGGVARTVRATVLDELHSDYVRTARSKGISERAVFLGHVLRNAMLPILTLLGLSFAALLTGAVLVENIFSWNGLGQYTVYAAQSLDYPALYGTCMTGALIFLTANLVTDVLYGIVDPKVRLT
jgi:peptide/nickel transport system permease protein